MQRIALLLTFLFATAASAEVHFVSPATGAQVIGRMAVEVSTDVPNVNRVEFLVDGELAGVARSAPWRVVHDFGLAPHARKLEAKVWSEAFSRTTSVAMTTASISAGESMTIDLVEVPVRVRSPKQLRSTDLQIRENGRDQTIRELLPQRGAAHFVFVIDRSLSMGGGRLEATLAGVDAARRMLRAGDTASVVLFNHNVAARRSLLPGEQLSRILAEVTPSGGTSLRDALASLPASDRTYAIVITDGSDRNSAIAEETALRGISGTRTVVDAVVFGSPSRFLEKAAANTGGTILRAQNDTVAAQLERILGDINSRYVAVYQSSGGKRGWRTIAVSPRGSRIAVLNARKGYYAR